MFSFVLLFSFVLPCKKLKTNQSHLQKFRQLCHSKLRMLTALDSRRITAMIDQYKQTEQEFKDSKGKMLALRSKLAKHGKGINGMSSKATLCFTGMMTKKGPGVKKKTKAAKAHETKAGAKVAKTAKAAQP